MLENSGTVFIQDMPIQVEMVTTDASLGIDGVRVDGVEQWADYATRGNALAPVPMRACLDLVIRNPSPSMPRSATPGNMVPAPRSLGPADPGDAKLGLSIYPGTLSPPVS
jgi:hypothetical protein